MLFVKKILVPIQAVFFAILYEKRRARSLKSAKLVLLPLSSFYKFNCRVYKAKHFVCRLSFRRNSPTIKILPHALSIYQGKRHKCWASKSSKYACCCYWLVMFVELNRSNLIRRLEASNIIFLEWILNILGIFWFSREVLWTLREVNKLPDKLAELPGKSLDFPGKFPKNPGKLS